MYSRLACLLLVVALSASSGCSLFRSKDRMDASQTARMIYERGNSQMRSGNFAAAITTFEGLTAMFPFSEEARQAQLAVMYAYWRNDEPDSVISAADRFILENPTHPRADYALYMKGLARFPRDPGPLERLFRVNMDKRPPGQMESSFNAFAQLLQQYPNSEYVDDARQRMIYLRNRLAAHEIEVAEYYFRRDAFVAAINRSRYVIETYQETDHVITALQIMARSYDRLQLPELAEDMRRVIAANEAATQRR